MILLFACLPVFLLLVMTSYFRASVTKYFWDKRLLAENNWCHNHSCIIYSWIECIGWGRVKDIIGLFGGSMDGVRIQKGFKCLRPHSVCSWRIVAGDVIFDPVTAKRFLAKPPITGSDALPLIKRGLGKTRKKSECTKLGIEFTTFRLLVWMLHQWVNGDSGKVGKYLSAPN